MMYNKEKGHAANLIVHGAERLSSDELGAIDQHLSQSTRFRTPVRYAAGILCMSRHTRVYSRFLHRSPTEVLEVIDASSMASITRSPIEVWWSQMLS